MSFSSYSSPLPKPLLTPAAAIAAAAAGTGASTTTETGRSTSTSSNLAAFYLITDVGDNDGSFLLHHFVSTHLQLSSSSTTPGTSSTAKSNHATAVVVGLASSQTHFEAVAKKLGYSLQRNASRIKYLDASQHLVSQTGPFILPGTGSGTTATTSTSPQNWSEALQNLVKTISSTFTSISAKEEKSTSPRLLVLDDISLFLYIGVPVSLLVKFVRSLLDVLQPMGGTLVIRMHADCTTVPSANLKNSVKVIRDKESESLFAALLMQASCHLHVGPIPSGYTDGVTGQILIKGGPWLLPHISKCCDIVDKTLLYHIGDASVKFFAPGLIS